MPNKSIWEFFSIYLLIHFGCIWDKGRLLYIFILIFICLAYSDRRGKLQLYIVDFDTMHVRIANLAVIDKRAREWSETTEGARVWGERTLGARE